MRRFLILLFLFPSICFGQACTENTFLPAPDPTLPFPPPGYNTYNCTTLTISSAGLNRKADGSDEPLIINVTGDVVINGNINVDGGDGFILLTDPTDGPYGGPGASRGGGISGAEGEPGGPFTFFPPEGSAPSRNGTCEEGGSGAGGFDTAGGDGLNCSGTPTITGGSSWGSFPLTRGGYGGGAGGAFDTLGVFSTGSGGGGGGAIHIISTSGKITIARNVVISARGGRGGDANSPGGAGGGGSGGVVILDGALGVFNSGVINVQGGRAGINSGIGGQGGAGRSGVYRIVNAGEVIEGTGSTAPLSSSSKLTSDISCGTIASKNEDKNLFFQMIIGFAFVLTLSEVRRRTRLS